MKLEQWTLFIDMLGYREMNGNITTESDARDFTSFMKNNVQIFEKQDSEEMKEGYAKSGFDLYKFYDIKVIFVSDSLMITYFPKEVEEDITEKKRILHSANTLHIILQRLQTYLYHCMKEKKILVRGGISNKFTLIDDQFAVGIGIMEAYLLESEKAIYPRIILSESICNNKSLIESFEYISSQIYKRPTFLKDDGDGIFYLDYLRYNMTIALQDITLKTLEVIDGFLTVHKETIEFHIDKTSKTIEDLKTKGEMNTKVYSNLLRVLDKYLWIKKYHNSSLKEFNNEKLEHRFLIQ